MVALVKNWYKAAYVGLEDTENEGTFENPMGYLLSCTRFRFWGPGHPRPKRKREDCVILDVEKVWRVINCKIKLSFICEFYPEAPNNPHIDFELWNCTKIKNKRKKTKKLVKINLFLFLGEKRKCREHNKMYEIYKNSSRMDQCVLIDDAV